MADTATSPATNGKTRSDESKMPLTHYHSFFSDLLSWDSPRTSAIAYVSIASFIVAARYLDVIRYAFKLTWIVLGVTVAAEILGKATLNNGLASQLRPRKYYTIPRETFDALLGDAHELLNFFVIEAQRIAFAENVYATSAAFVAALLSYYLIKVVPYWGLALIGTTVVFFAPLVYKTNKELIDSQVKQVSDLVDAQTSQLRQVANKHTSQATELTKQYMGDYTAKAQQLLRGRTTASEAAVAAAPSAPKTAPKAKLSEADFPSAPKKDIEESEEESEEEPLIST